MGLDGVELLISVEETFGVTITDDEATKAETPRKLIDLVFSKLQKTTEKSCQSQRAFYVLRKSLMRQFNLDRKSVTPNMLFRELIPKEREKHIWMELKTAVCARSWPDLVRPWWLLMMTTATGISVFAVVLLFLVRIIGFFPSFIVGIVLTGLFWKYVNKATRPFRVRIPFRFRRIQDLVPYAVTSDKIKWTRNQVSELVKKLVIEQLNISESKYHEDAHFIKDLDLN